MNQRDLDPSQIDEMLKTASKKLGTSPEALRQQLESGNLQSAFQKMGPKNAAKIQKIMSDPKLAEQFLSNAQIQAQLKKIMRGEG